MRTLKQLGLWVGLLQSFLAFNQEVEGYRGNPDASFFAARELAFSGKRKEAKDTLTAILTEYPQYTDVSNLLGKIYSWEGEYDKARAQFNKVTSSHSKDKEAWIAAVSNEMYAQNYTIAVGLSNKALLFIQGDPDLERLREQALQNVNTKYSAASDFSGNLLVVQDSVAGNTKEKILKNKLGIFGVLDVFDVVFDPMIATSLEYTRTTKMGSVIPRINYANRFQTSGIQYEIDLYPKFSKIFYGYFNYGYSNAPIYPDHRVGAELYANLPNAFETSIGLRYLEFENIKANIITGSAGLYTGNYYFSLRPYITLPVGSNPVGVSGSLLVRKYLKDKDNYFGLNAAVGYAPELRQLRAGDTLLAETLLYIESQQLSLEYQFTGASLSSIYRLNVGVLRQELAFDAGNFFWAVSAGISYQFKF